MQYFEMKQIVYPVITGITISLALSLSGCSRLAMNDGSLAYQKSKLLNPVVLPEGQETRHIYPLYQLPDKDTANQVPLTNRKGNRYQLPRASTPIEAAPVADSRDNQIASQQTADVENPKPRIILTRTEEGVPILQSPASLEATTSNLRHALKRAKYTILDSKPGKLTISHAAFSGERMLQFRNLGSVTTVLVTHTDAQLASNQEAASILSSLRAQW